MKKQIKISGTPVRKIQVGSPAVILEGELTRRYFSGRSSWDFKKTLGTWRQANIKSYLYR